MGIFTPDKIEYDSEAIATMQAKISKTAEDLNKLNEEVKKAMTDMEEDWKTTEGKKFLSDVDTDWSVQVEKYVAVLDTLSKMLAQTEQLYSELSEKARSITF